MKQLHSLSYVEYLYSYSVLSEQMLKTQMCIWKTYPHRSIYLHILFHIHPQSLSGCSSRDWDITG